MANKLIATEVKAPNKIVCGDAEQQVIEILQLESKVLTGNRRTSANPEIEKP